MQPALDVQFSTHVSGVQSLHSWALNVWLLGFCFVFFIDTSLPAIDRRHPSLLVSPWRCARPLANCSIQAFIDGPDLVIALILSSRCHNKDKSLGGLVCPHVRVVDCCLRPGFNLEIKQKRHCRCFGFRRGAFFQGFNLLVCT